MKNLKTLYLIIISLFLFTACSQKEPLLLDEHDLEKNTAYANDNFMDQNKQTQEFFNKYFKPWDLQEVSYSKIEAMWGLSYKFKKIYLENHTTATSSWFDKQIKNANFDEYNTLKIKAITLKNINVRVLPTNSVMFYNPNEPGEGFPFDYNQNSLLKINTPIIVSHLSKDKAWAYIQSYSVGGWVEINSIAFVDENFISQFKTNNYYVAIKEKFPIYDPIFREYVKVSTIFPKYADRFIIAKADENQNAKITYIVLNNEVEKMPLAFNTENRIKISKEFLDEPYGWGGLLNNRDCSSFTQDFFRPFGKFLERNSKAQTKNGNYFDISDLSNDEKKEYIRKNGVPFSTLVYLKGHIMLYIGTKDNEPLVMHNMWSVRLKDKWGKKYRHIVGKTTITTLEPGNDLKDFDKDNSILKKIQGIVIL